MEGGNPSGKGVDKMVEVMDWNNVECHLLMHKIYSACAA